MALPAWTLPFHSRGEVLDLRRFNSTNRPFEPDTQRCSVFPAWVAANFLQDDPARNAAAEGTFRIRA